MIKVSIIGSGNVASHLINAFENSIEIELVQVFSRNIKVLEGIVSSDKITDNISSLKDADLYIISVSDSAIAKVSQQLLFSGRLVVHTAGSLSADVLDGKNRSGIFYPLQTFSKNRVVDFAAIPICIEAVNPEDHRTLEMVAKAISNSVFTIGANQRKALHVAAVFVNNFTNHLYGIAAGICENNDVPFNILKPLIRETAEKVMAISPKEAQTGPALRGDEIILQSHLDFLTDQNTNNIYKILTQSIQHDAKL
jgi:predicted short-subunit dehydrogenase-like oxidoreductase (DUF2520 family)